MNSPIFNPQKIIHGVPASYTPLGLAGQIEDAARMMVKGMGLKSIGKDLNRVAKAIAHAPAALVNSIPFGSMMKDIFRVAGLVGDTPGMLARTVRESGGGTHKLQDAMSHSRAARNLRGAVSHLIGKLETLNKDVDKMLSGAGKFIEDLVGTVGRLLEGGLACVIGAAKTVTLSALKKGAQAFFAPRPAAPPKHAELSLQPQAPVAEPDEQHEFAEPAQANEAAVSAPLREDVGVLIYRRRILIIQGGDTVLISTCLLYLTLQLSMGPPMIPWSLFLLQ